MPRRIAIHAGYVVAFDGRGHRLLRDGTVIVDGDRIAAVGRRADAGAETVSETIDAPDGVLTPGLISTHAHIGGSPLDRSFIEDRGNPQFFYSGLFELLPVRGAAQDEDATRACVDFSMAELLRGGVTTVMEIGGASEYVVVRAADYGLRVYVGLAFRSGRWLTRDGRRVTVLFAAETRIDFRELVRDLAMQVAATSPTYGTVTVVIVKEPGQACYYLLCQATPLTAPRLIRAWKRRSWIEYYFRTLKHLLATEACQVHGEDAYYGHLVLRLLAGLVLLYTARRLLKGCVTMEEIVFSLKHHWRFLTSKDLELHGLSWGLSLEAA